MSTIPDGLYPNRSEDEHRALPLLSPSGLYELARSPARWKYRQTHPIEPTPAMRCGTLVHGLALQGMTPPGYGLRPPGLDLRTREGKAWRDAQSPGCTLVDGEDWDRAHAAAESIRSHPLVAEWLRVGQVEVSMVWTDPETGVQIKGRADLVSIDALLGPLVADIKCLSVGPDLEDVQRACWSARYDRQIALYASGMEILTGHAQTGVVIAVDPDPPHGVGVYPLAPVLQLRGLRDARALLAVYAECVRTGEWWADDRLTAPLGAELTAPRWAMGEGVT